MHLSHLNGRDLWEMERRESRAGQPALAPGNPRRGVMVQEDFGYEAKGVATYDITDGMLTVNSLRAHDFNREIGRMLVSGLKGAAAANQANSIWLIAPQDPTAHDFLGHCGFKLMAFCQADPGYARSPRLEYWILE